MRKRKQVLSQRKALHWMMVPSDCCVCISHHKIGTRSSRFGNFDAIVLRGGKYAKIRGPTYWIHTIVCPMQGYSAEYVDIFAYFAWSMAYFALDLLGPVFSEKCAPLGAWCLPRTSKEHAQIHTHRFFCAAMYKKKHVNTSFCNGNQRCEIRQNTWFCVSNAQHRVFDARM